MNKIFSFERWGKVLALDFKSYIRNFGISLIVLSCIPITLWILNLLFERNSSEVGRGILIWALAIFGVIMAPSKVYGKVNLSREGVAFAMLPASSFEKFLSMFVYCAIVTPIVCLLGAWIVDSLLVVLSFGDYGFKDYVGLFSFLYGELDSTGNIANLSVNLQDLISKSMLDFGLIGSLLQSSAFFMLGNMLFKKHKTGKSLACLIGIAYVISTILSCILFYNAEAINAYFDSMTAEMAVVWFHNMLNWNVVIKIAIILVLLYFVYRRIRKQTY